VAQQVVPLPLAPLQQPQQQQQRASPLSMLQSRAGEARCVPPCPGACFNGQCLFLGSGVEDEAPGANLASGWDSGLELTRQQDGSPLAPVVPLPVSPGPTHPPIAVPVASSSWSSSEPRAAPQQRSASAVESPSRLAELTSPTSAATTAELEKLMAAEVQLAKTMQELGGSGQEQQTVAVRPHDEPVPDALQVAEAKAARLEQENAKLKRQLDIWHHAGESIAVREAGVAQFLEDRHAEVEAVGSGTAVAVDEAAVPDESTRRRGDDPGMDGGGSSRRRRRTASAGGQLTAMQLLEMHAPQRAEGAESVDGSSKQAKQAMPLTLVDNLSAYTMRSPRLASSVLGVLVMVIATASVVCFAQMVERCLRPGGRGRALNRAKAAKVDSRVSQRSSGASTFGALLQRAGLVSKTCGVVEVAELQVGNIDEMLGGSSLHVVIEPGNGMQAESTRSGVRIDPPDDSPSSSSNADCQYIAFSDDFMFDVDQGDGLWVFSVFNCDALMDDKIASVSLPAKELLSMARQRREYFSMELRMQSRHWQRLDESQGIRPFISMRLAELDPSSSRVQQARSRHSALSSRGPVLLG